MPLSHMIAETRVIYYYNKSINLTKLIDVSLERSWDCSHLELKNGCVIFTKNATLSVMVCQFKKEIFCSICTLTLQTIYKELFYCIPIYHSETFPMLHIIYLSIAYPWASLEYCTNDKLVMHTPPPQTSESLRTKIIFHNLISLQNK